ncbi:hypothetical protein SISSUDRAFT_1040198 [Sistotremastrum suecicum HHB10207 ss-3]|uniref:Uncharacterized protein n=1 Tax=Sistotremastrum suecicum HHB10207 ss-3 TaxID=1314776 RepID=A0A166I0J8_9AGAM|nr:hypothetical protein SISSUDRAFT_1040198 [Sistotremastrum suecicum HHB10207 ss-3]
MLNMIAVNPSAQSSNTLEIMGRVVKTIRLGVSDKTFTVPPDALPRVSTCFNNAATNMISRIDTEAQEDLVNDVVVLMSCLAVDLGEVDAALESNYLAYTPNSFLCHLPQE